MTELEQHIFSEIDKIELIDPYTQINSLDPTANSLADILGHHYFTELAHSAGMDPDRVKYTVKDENRIKAVLEYMPRFSNTAQYHWFLDIAQEFFNFNKNDVTIDDFDFLKEQSKVQCDADWEQKVISHTGLVSVFVPYDFGSPPDKRDPFYLPLLKMDDLVAIFDGQKTRARLNKITDIDVTNANSLRLALHKVFDIFEGLNFVACSCIIPPDLELNSFSQTRIDNLVIKANRGEHFNKQERNELATFILVELSYRCQEHNVPFQLRVGGVKDVYDHGVIAGTDLLDQRTSLFNLRKLFNMFPKVYYPVSIISHPQNHELVSFAWIYHNVLAFGHWSYSNIPTMITHDVSARLQSIPRNKIIGYFSDAPKLEFILPKFKMYKKSLARVLARDFIGDQKWSEEKVVDLATDILHNNVKAIYNL
jgi:glucuronate isomerase